MEEIDKCYEYKTDLTIWRLKKYITKEGKHSEIHLVHFSSVCYNVSDGQNILLPSLIRAREN